MLESLDRLIELEDPTITDIVLEFARSDLPRPLKNILNEDTPALVKVCFHLINALQECYGTVPMFPEAIHKQIQLSILDESPQVRVLAARYLNLTCGGKDLLTFLLKTFVQYQVCIVNDSVIESPRLIIFYPQVAMEDIKNIILFVLWDLDLFTQWKVYRSELCVNVKRCAGPVITSVMHLVLARLKEICEQNVGNVDEPALECILEFNSSFASLIRYLHNQSLTKKLRYALDVSQAINVEHFGPTYMSDEKVN